jgi:hypothetical protein
MKKAHHSLSFWAFGDILSSMNPLKELDEMKQQN